MKRILIFMFCAFLLAGCGAKAPYAYSSRDGEFRPINDPSRYSKEQIEEAKKSYKNAYKGTQSNSAEQNDNSDPSGNLGGNYVW